MAKPKKGALHQVLVPMVDATDFATPEGAITASDFNSGATVKFFGWNTGSSAATTSAAVSKIASLVHSGIFRITLKTTENNYDNMMLKVTKTGCARQLIQWSNVDNDDSDIMSMLTVIVSAASDAASAAQQTNSRVLLNQSRISDIASYLVVMSGVQSDIYSALLVTQSQASDLASKLSDVESNLLSFLTTTGVNLNASAFSDVRSAITANTPTLSASDISDIASAVAAQFTLSASAMSDIASQVWAHTIGARVDSRVLLNLSRISDIQSLLSNVNSVAASSPTSSDIASVVLVVLTAAGVPLNASSMSDLRSAITAGATGLDASALSDIASAVVAALNATGVEVTASAASNIASAVWAHTIGTRVDSRILVNQSVASDTLSRCVVIASMASDAASAAQQANSRVLVIQSAASDAASAAQQANSRLLVNQSVVSDIYSLVTAGAPLGASDMSDIRSAISANGVLRAGADPTTVVGVTGTLAAKVDFITAIHRNKITQNSAVQSLRNDGDSADICSAATSDDGTVYTRGKFA